MRVCGVGRPGLLVCRQESSRHAHVPFSSTLPGSALPRALRQVPPCARVSLWGGARTGPHCEAAVGLAKASSRFKGDLHFRMTRSLNIFSGNAFPDPAPSVLACTHIPASTLGASVCW